MPYLVILAGGMATRLGHLTAEIPKALISVAGKPFIAHQLQLAAREGIKRVVLCVGHMGERIQDFVDDGSRFGLHVSYSLDGHRLMGTGGAVMKALPILSSVFIVIYGDSYLDTSYRPILEQFQASGKLGLMTVFRNDNQWDRSNIEFRENSIISYDKKNFTQGMRHIDYGLSVLKAEIFDEWPTDEPYDLADVFHALIERRELAGYEVKERFYEIGSPEGLRETDFHLSKKREKNVILG